MLRVLVLWLGSLFYGLPWMGDKPIRHQGATVGWSPTAETKAVGDAARWDVRGWYEDSQRRTHREMLAVEKRLDDALESLLASVYLWRDSEVMA